MVFKSTGMKRMNADRGEIYGELTLHGITQKVRFDVMFMGRKESPVSGKDTAGFRLQSVIRCSDFQLASKYIPSMISDNVRIVVDCEFSVSYTHLNVKKTNNRLEKAINIDCKPVPSYNKN